MTGKFPLQPLLDLANTRMDEAARRLGELIASERDGQKKLEMLQGYRDEYHGRFMEAVRNGIGPDAWRNFSAFIGKLDDAIATQRKIVEQSRDRTAQGQEIWLAQRNRVKAFDTLSQRHQAGVARQEAKREQKLSDEHTARRYSGSGSDEA
ncbi:flagellar export protein FliJ [Azoarcus olearius]|uniref:Flagellar FliJ protein n=1 Tax=Azoarcus sp. (strain BH72) TaxID=418699 RepID=A1K931_AZOSB|nr:flagellar export protein FliJ [Azoarcus olearius]CAL95336.1 putative flagellar protein FliJ [Azoarcus olearius]